MATEQAYLSEWIDDRADGSTGMWSRNVDDEHQESTGGADTDDQGSGGSSGHAGGPEKGETKPCPACGDEVPPSYLPAHLNSADCQPCEDSELAADTSDPGVNSRPSPGFEQPDTEEVH